MFNKRKTNKNKINPKTIKISDVESSSDSDGEANPVGGLNSKSVAKKKAKNKSKSSSMEASMCAYLENVSQAPLTDTSTNGNSYSSEYLAQLKKEQLYSIPFSNEEAELKGSFTDSVVVTEHGPAMESKSNSSSLPDEQIEYEIVSGADAEMLEQQQEAMGSFGHSDILNGDGSKHGDSTSTSLPNVRFQTELMDMTDKAVLQRARMKLKAETNSMQDTKLGFVSKSETKEFIPLGNSSTRGSFVAPRTGVGVGDGGAATETVDDSDSALWESLMLERAGLKHDIANGDVKQHRRLHTSPAPSGFDSNATPVQKTGFSLSMAIQQTTTNIDKLEAHHSSCANRTSMLQVKLDEARKKRRECQIKLVENANNLKNFQAFRLFVSEMVGMMREKQNPMAVIQAQWKDEMRSQFREKTIQEWLLYEDIWFRCIQSYNMECIPLNSNTHVLPNGMLHSRYIHSSDSNQDISLPLHTESPVDSSCAGRYVEDAFGRTVWTSDQDTDLSMNSESNVNYVAVPQVTDPQLYVDNNNINSLQNRENMRYHRYCANCCLMEEGKYSEESSGVLGLGSTSGLGSGSTGAAKGNSSLTMPLSVYMSSVDAAKVASRLQELRSKYSLLIGDVDMSSVSMVDNEEKVPLGSVPDVVAGVSASDLLHIPTVLKRFRSFRTRYPDKYSGGYVSHSLKDLLVHTVWLQHQLPFCLGLGHDPSSIPTSALDANMFQRDVGTGRNSYLSMHCEWLQSLIEYCNPTSKSTPDSDAITSAATSDKAAAEDGFMLTEVVVELIAHWIRDVWFDKNVDGSNDVPSGLLYHTLSLPSRDLGVHECDGVDKLAAFQNAFHFFDFMQMVEMLLVCKSLTQAWRLMSSSRGPNTGSDSNIGTSTLNSVEIARNDGIIRTLAIEIVTQFNKHVSAVLNSICLVVPTVLKWDLIQLPPRNHVPTDVKLNISMLSVVARVLGRLTTCHKNILCVLSLRHFKTISTQTYALYDSEHLKSLYELVDVSLLVQLLTALHTHVHSNAHRNGLVSVLQCCKGECLVGECAQLEGKHRECVESLLGYLDVYYQCMQIGTRLLHDRQLDATESAIQGISWTGYVQALHGVELCVTKCRESLKKSVTEVSKVAEPTASEVQVIHEPSNTAKTTMSMGFVASSAAYSTISKPAVPSASKAIPLMPCNNVYFSELIQHIQNTL